MSERSNDLRTSSARSRRCQFCGSIMDRVTAEACTQNPFCNDCFAERMANAAEVNPVIRCDIEDGYVVPVRQNSGDGS